MFVVLRQNEIQKGCFKKKRQLKQIEKSEVQTVKTDNGLPFYIVDVPIFNGDVLWGGVEEKCGRYASRIVASRAVSLPDSNTVKRYTPTVLPVLVI